ncbi:hypothetical protein CK203_110474 [Vitis vinifera]|uniref:Retrotransposon gag domain-containing protein n=1 Tax=Vitis vinifera TaxID=29760 RepID=A0A438CE40_VITVI|nr:hypothetical protein CK203_110474 [Vitis vinifera]
MGKVENSIAKSESGLQGEKQRGSVMEHILDDKSTLYSKVFLLLTMHEPCREKGAGNFKMEANFAAWRHPLVISCEFVKGNPRLKITLNGINFVDHFLNQGAPAEHKSAETPIGHESNGAAAGGMSVKFKLIPLLSTCDFHHKLWIRDIGGRLIKCDTPQRGELEVILNIMEAAPEDQHSHQGRQDNLNEFRSMRDRMHPPRMSAPSCIVPPTEQLVIRPYLVPLLPTFHGMESENPYAHIKEFEDNKWLEKANSNFSAKENEKFYECWERYMEAINACPHHGFDTGYWRFMSKNPEEAMDFLSYVADVSRGWDEPTKGEVGKMKSQLNAYNAKAGCII